MELFSEYMKNQDGSTDLDVIKKRIIEGNNKDLTNSREELSEMVELILSTRNEIPEIPELETYNKELTDLSDKLSYIESKLSSLPDYGRDISFISEELSRVKTPDVGSFRWIGESFSTFEEKIDNFQSHVNQLRDKISSEVTGINEIIELKDDNQSIEVNNLKYNISQRIKETNNLLDETKSRIYSELNESSLKVDQYYKEFKDDDAKLKEAILIEQNKISKELEKEITSINEGNATFITFLDEIKEQVNSLPEVKYYDSEISNLTKDVDSLKSSMNAIESLSLKSNIEIQKDVDSLKSTVKDVKNLKATISELKTISASIKKDQKQLKETYKKDQKQLNETYILDQPPSEKQTANGVTDVLTPLNQKFATLDDLSSHYRLFINRIQAQLSTMGGGGAVQLNDLDDVNTSGLQNGNTLVWDSKNNYWAVGNEIDTAAVANDALSLAKGSALNLKQELLSAAGEPGRTVLAVAATTSGKVQGVSLGDGNVIEVFANGADYNNSVVLYREFLSAGEPICFTGISPGAIITSSKGFYGVSEQVRGSQTGPMPLMSLGFAFTNTFIFCFRFSNDSAGVNRGEIYITAGPLPTKVSLFRGTGAEVNDPTFNGGVGRMQTDIELEAFGSTVLVPNGNTEFQIIATNPVIGAVQSRMGAGAETYSDTRLIMPLTNDGIVWAKSGYISAPYDNTVVGYYERDGVSGTFNVSPGSPVRLAGIPVAPDADYEPDGATRMIALGLISGFSGADGAGGEATPMLPTKALSQIVPQPYWIPDSGDGGNSGVSIASPYTGTAKIYEWNPTTLTADLAYTVNLNRGNDGAGIPPTSPTDQRYPVAGQVANESALAADVSVIQLTGQLDAGYIVSDVPIVVVAQANNSNTAPAEIRSQDGTTTAPILTASDETLMVGVTPPTLRAEIMTDTDFYLRKRVVAADGSPTYPLV